jgi:hypothetical protein
MPRTLYRVVRSEDTLEYRGECWVEPAWVHFTNWYTNHVEARLDCILDFTRVVQECGSSEGYLDAVVRSTVDRVYFPIYEPIRFIK